MPPKSKCDCIHWTFHFWIRWFDFPQRWHNFNQEITSKMRKQILVVVFRPLKYSVAAVYSLISWSVFRSTFLTKTFNILKTSNHGCSSKQPNRFATSDKSLRTNHNQAKINQASSDFIGQSQHVRLFQHLLIPSEVFAQNFTQRIYLKIKLISSPNSKQPKWRTTWTIKQSLYHAFAESRTFCKLSSIFMLLTAKHLATAQACWVPTLRLGLIESALIHKLRCLAR